MNESEVGSKRSMTLSAGIAALAIAAAATASGLFPRAFPVIALKQEITRDVAVARADSFFRAHELAPARARTAVRFRGNDSLTTYIGLAGGGHDSLNALLRGRDVAPFTWSVRAFVPGNPREARVTFAPTAASGFTRHSPGGSPAGVRGSGRVLAENVLAPGSGDAGRWKGVAS